MVQIVEELGLGDGREENIAGFGMGEPEGSMERCPSNIAIKAEMGVFQADSIIFLHTINFPPDCWNKPAAAACCGRFRPQCLLV